VYCRRFPWIPILLVALGVACSEESEPPSVKKPEAPASQPAPAAPASPSAESAGKQVAAEVDGRSQEELIAAGRSVYNANCIACHAMDPSRDGALGPAVAGSSHELLEARIVHGNYPEGYTPKRESRVMVALPHLEPRLGELTAYLNSL
jgi:mono/diheme cytochrome c family protein